MAYKPLVYVSSTFADLKDHRGVLKSALEKAQFDVECMEKYRAFDERPLEKCLADVRRADMYVLVLAQCCPTGGSRRGRWTRRFESGRSATGAGRGRFDSSPTPVSWRSLSRRVQGFSQPAI